MMRSILRYWLHFLLLLLIGISQHSCQQDQPDAEKYLKAIQGFADTLLEHGRDSYGDVHTALFVDGLDTVSLEPTLWKGKGGETWIMSNFASQQALMRLLDGLSVVTGDDKYSIAAEDAAREVMTSLRTPNGLLYWGGHAAWDLERNVNVGEYDSRYHEVKTHQPYFRLMWKVNPDATRDLLETLWGGISWIGHAWITIGMLPTQRLMCVTGTRNLTVTLRCHFLPKVTISLFAM